jgi:hypothetical protein
MKIHPAKWAVLALGLSTVNAWALELDWSGQFRAENHYVRHYQMDALGNITRDAARDGVGGYYIPGGGSDNSTFQTLFLRLRPKLVVNDNIYIKSEWWLGDPVYGLFGNAAPYTVDQRQYYSSQSRGSTITAQRFWAEFLTDVGTVQVGRAPLHWGLGLFWNSGEGLWDRYESTGDVIRLVSKFGAFSFVPSVVKYSLGNTIGGACTIAAGACSNVAGAGGMSDYSLQLKYENPDEDFEGGVNFVKRIAGAVQDSTYGYFGVQGVPAGMNYNTWDLYGRKKFGRFSLAGELPITTGDIGGIEYKTFAAAIESELKIGDSWETSLRFGHAPGQPGGAVGATPSRYKAYFFNQNYRIGLIMFNYQLANFAAPSAQNNPNASVRSPFDNPVVNANYLSLLGGIRTDKWRFHAGLVFAKALEPAADQSSFFNTWSRSFANNTSGISQSDSLGWEMDYGAAFQWDETFQFGLDLGWFFPGDFYKFTNVAGRTNATDTVFATVFRVGVVF